jgi:hypothetical protein
MRRIESATQPQLKSLRAFIRRSLRVDLAIRFQRLQGEYT